MFDSRRSLKGAMKIGTFVNVALLKGGIQGDCSLASSAPQNLAEGAETQPLRHNCKEQRHREQTKGPKDEKLQKAIDCELTSQCLPAQRWQGLQAATKTRTNHKTPDSKALQLSYPLRILREDAFFLLQ
jgi:hypothetical protein